MPAEIRCGNCEASHFPCEKCALRAELAAAKQAASDAQYDANYGKMRMQAMLAAEPEGVPPESPVFDRVEALVKRLRRERDQLWQLLDDIDTLDDSCRDYNDTFRTEARAVQKKRWDIHNPETASKKS